MPKAKNTLSTILNNLFNNGNPTIIHRIKWKERELLLVGSWTAEYKEGAIATQEQYDNFEMNEAHLFENGQIKRFNQVVGSVDEIEYIGLADETK